VSGVIAAADDNTGADAREIEVAAPNLQLRLGSDTLDGFTTIRIAEVVRTPAGGLAFDDRFIPTSLRLAPAVALQAAGRRLIELLVAQRAVLAERRQAILRKQALTPADVVALHLYEVVCGAIPRVSHTIDGDGASPEDLFLTMAELAARLASWVPAARVPDLPLYEHADLTGCFGRLTSILWELLGDAAPEADYVEIPLHPLRPNVFAGQAEKDTLERGALFLLASAPDSADEGALVDLPARLRVASPQTIESVLRSATRALPLEVVDSPPPGVPVRPGARVLALQKKGPFWEAIVAGSGVAVYVPAEVGRLDLKLIAVLRL
jgi:type VI secretion system protein ImpJ